MSEDAQTKIMGERHMGEAADKIEAGYAPQWIGKGGKWGERVKMATGRG